MTNSAIANLRHRINWQGHSLPQCRAVRYGRGKNARAVRLQRLVRQQNQGDHLRDPLLEDTRDSKGLILRWRRLNHDLYSGNGKGSCPGAKTKSFIRNQVKVADLYRETAPAETDSEVVQRDLGFLVSPLERSLPNCHPSHQTSTCTTDSSQTTRDDDDPNSDYGSQTLYPYTFGDFP